MVFPSGVWTRKVAWPSHVSSIPCSFMNTPCNLRTNILVAWVKARNERAQSTTNAAIKFKPFRLRPISCIRWCSMPDLKVLLSRQTIAKRVAELGEEIARDFQGQSIIFVGVLKGAAIFLSDLARQVPLDATFDFIGVSSYGNRPTAKDDPAGHAAWDSLGEVRLTKDLDQSLADRNVILVEDILDTGLTLNYISRLMQGHRPKSLRIAALLDKPSRRKQPIHAQYIGFTIARSYA